MCPKGIRSKQTTLGLGALSGFLLWLSEVGLPAPHADHLSATATSLCPSPPPNPTESSCCAVSQVFPLPSLSRKQRTVLVVCGPEQNGAVGLACARHLRVFVSNRAVMWGTETGLGSCCLLPPSPKPCSPQEYQPSIFYPARSADALHRDLTTQCEKMDIPFLSFLPAEVRCAHPAPALTRPSVATDTVPLPRCGSSTTRTGWWWTLCLGRECDWRRQAGPARALWPR